MGLTLSPLLETSLPHPHPLQLILAPQTSHTSISDIISCTSNPATLL
jgi:hypothetical protein